MNQVELYPIDKRKENGVFYTPDFLADYLSQKVLQYHGKSNGLNSIIDPACGDSALLRSFLKAFDSDDKSKFPKVYGTDNDINAINNSISKLSTPQFKNFKSQFIHCDGLFPNVEKNTIQGWTELKNNLNIKKGFDIALSNPPWGADISKYKPRKLNSNFNLSKGQFDIYNLFVEVILNNLNENGHYGLILPDSVFNQEQSKFRCLLTKNTTIKLIARLGEKIFPEINRACVVIIGCNSKPSKTHKVDCFRLSSSYKKKVIANEQTLEKIESELSHKVPQIRFSENENCIFDIDLRADSRKTFDIINNRSIPLRTFVKNTRGAEISKKGIVWQCSNCDNWTPAPRAKEPRCKKCNHSFDIELTKKENIILNHNGAGNIKLKVGEDLFRYTSISKSWINTKKEGINYKNLEIYNGDKILVRKTGVGITASLDYDCSITNQVVYILKINPIYSSKISLEFVLAVLNSRLMTYFLIKKHGENEWRSHPYLTQTMLINLPFPNIDFNSRKKIELMSKITRIIKKEITNSNNKNISKENDLFIEKTIAHFFGVNKEDYNTIFETLNSSDQLIPIKRLVNCNANEIFSVNGI